MNTKSNGKCRLKFNRLELLLAGLMFSALPRLAAAPATNAYLAFACNGVGLERRVLLDASATWLANQSRVFAPGRGRLLYRVPVGHTALERLYVEVNPVPYRLEFSGDSNHWETLSLRTAATNLQQFQAVLSLPMASTNLPPFQTQEAAFTPAQAEAARTSGFAWFRFQPTTESVLGPLQLQYFRLDVSGSELPPRFVRLSPGRSLSVYAAGPLMLLVGMVPVLFVWRRWRLPWWLWGAGAALWVASVALKGLAAWLTLVPVSLWLQRLLPFSWAGPMFWCYLGSLTGVFECGIFLAVAWLLRRRVWTWREALTLGLGFGGVEAVVAGLLTGVTVWQAGFWDCVGRSSDALTAPFERLITLPIHAAAAVMILHGLRTRQWRWFWVSFVYKNAIDTIAAWLIVAQPNIRFHPWLMESLCFAPFALLGLLLLAYLKKVWAEPTAPPVL